MSANVSYEHAAEDVAYLTGVQVSSSVQQRLVHCQSFELPEIEPTVAELSVDGGNIRVRTPVGEPSVWQGYKAVCLHELKTVGASFQNNAVLIDWVNAQPVAPILTCLGDGHDGIWNIIQLLAPDGQRREVLDWFHLVENLSKVGGSLKRLQQAEALLWRFGKSRRHLPCLLTANCRKLTISASTLRSIVTASSTISIIKRSRFVLLALGP